MKHTRALLLAVATVCLASIAGMAFEDLVLGASVLSPRPAGEIFLKPAEPVSVGNAQFPPDATNGGVVVLDVALMDSGKAAEIGAVRDIPPFTAAAASAVQGWKFNPALVGDMPVPSALTVAFVYRPPVSIWNPAPFAPAIPDDSSSTNAIQPPGIVSVAYANYPVNNVASGAVIVQLSLDTDGKIQAAKVIRGIGGLNRAALAAAKSWKFQPAKYEGEAVKSNVVIVFVFANPVVVP